MTAKYGTTAIAENELLPLPNPATPGNVLHFTFPEFTSVCPRSGYPDFATIHLWVMPGALIVELKSLKLYLNSFRERGIYHEEVAQMILDDIVKAIEPRWARIYCDFSPRGNLHTGITRVYCHENYPEGAVDYNPVERERSWHATGF